MPRVSHHDVTWERMIRAVEKVRRRLMRATTALEAAGVDYAVVGGHAVAAWVSRADEAAVRNTQDVDILIRRSDRATAARALEAAGFAQREVMGAWMFADSPTASARDAVHIVFAGEKVRDAAPAPDPADSEVTAAFRVINLDALVRMKLTSFRLKDRVHLLDMIEVGLIDSTWPDRLAPPLADRLRQLLENPGA